MASTCFIIPQTTLERYAEQRRLSLTEQHKIKLGRKPIFSPFQEADLVKGFSKLRGLTKDVSLVY
jgi:hypothetical protein